MILKNVYQKLIKFDKQRPPRTSEIHRGLITAHISVGLPFRGVRLNLAPFFTRLKSLRMGTFGM